MKEDTPEILPSLPKSILLPGCSGCGLGCLGTLLLASTLALLDFTILPFNTAMLASLAAFVVVFLTAIVARAKRKQPPWVLFLVEVAGIAIILCIYFAWDTPKYAMWCVLGDDIPGSVVLHRAEYEEHPMDPSSWIHFSAAPEDMAMLIASNQLTPVYPGRTTVGSYPGWFKHKGLPGARNFQKEFPHPEHTNHTAYVIGLWVNDKTNEAYGYFISL